MKIDRQLIIVKIFLIMNPLVFILVQSISYFQANRRRPKISSRLSKALYFMQTQAGLRNCTQNTATNHELEIAKINIFSKLRKYKVKLTC